MIISLIRSIQVRAASASGKTSLFHLLHAYIYSREPLAPVEIIESWQLSRDSMDRFPKQNHTITYQDTYPDFLLWSAFFKDIAFTKYYAILFCGYGSPSDSPVNHNLGTPVELLQAARVSLWPTGQTAGVLLTETEFGEVVAQFPKKICLHPTPTGDIRMDK